MAMNIPSRDSRQAPKMHRRYSQVGHLPSS